MSCVQVFGFDKDGLAYELGEVNNAFRGAMAVWNLLGDKYLNQKGSMFDMNYLRKIWALAGDQKVKMSHRIVMASTMDKVVVRQENVQKLIEAFEEFVRDFPGMTNLDKQIEVIKGLQDTDTGLAWCQTSVCEPFWKTWDEEKEEEVGYNLNAKDDHWFLFDDVK